MCSCPWVLPAYFCVICMIISIWLRANVNCNWLVSSQPHYSMKLCFTEAWEDALQVNIASIKKKTILNIFWNQNRKSNVNQFFPTTICHSLCARMRFVFFSPIQNAHIAYCFPGSLSCAASDSTAERSGGEEERFCLYWPVGPLLCSSCSLRSSSAAFLSSSSCCLSRLAWAAAAVAWKKESQKHFTQQTQWMYRNVSWGH